ncbi:MAG: hypothetical protein ACJ8C4_17585 [Gemmataceae bacterium]
MSSKLKTVRVPFQAQVEATGQRVYFGQELRAALLRVSGFFGWRKVGLAVKDDCYQLSVEFADPTATVETLRGVVRTAMGAVLELVGDCRQVA